MSKSVTSVLFQKRNRLEVIKEFIRLDKTSTNKYYLTVKCDCGTVFDIAKGSWASGRTKSCGCLNKETALQNAKRKHGKYGESCFRVVVCDYRRNAKRRGLDLTLTEDELHALFQGDCYYCGTKPSTICNRRDYYGEYVYNGIDRLNNSLGYVENNVVSCCKYCNNMKKNMSVQDFLNHIERIYKFGTSKAS